MKLLLRLLIKQRLNLDHIYIIANSNSYTILVDSEVQNQLQSMTSHVEIWIDYEYVSSTISPLWISSTKGWLERYNETFNYKTKTTKKYEKK